MAAQDMHHHSMNIYCSTKCMRLSVLHRFARCIALACNLCNDTLSCHCIVSKSYTRMLQGALRIVRELGPGPCILRPRSNIEFSNFDVYIEVYRKWHIALLPGGCLIDPTIAFIVSQKSFSYPYIRKTLHRCKLEPWQSFCVAFINLLIRSICAYFKFHHFKFRPGHKRVSQLLRLQPQQQSDILHRSHLKFHNMYFALPTTSALCMAAQHSLIEQQVAV